MDSVKGKVKFSFNNQVVDSIKDLPSEEFDELLSRLSVWRRTVSETVIKDYLSTQLPDEAIAWEWSSPKEDRSK
ncbi:hypothetical protein [Bacillus sp. J33]|uniref:hypothetical protein n=1 Tax=Bacillus sp. J33 TaxID=935836 RepID=UPI00047D1496|nr:hypothetical protein [Bacillus sp. J33]